MEIQTGLRMGENMAGGRDTSKADLKVGAMVGTTADCLGSLLVVKRVVSWGKNSVGWWGSATVAWMVETTVARSGLLLDLQSVEWLDRQMDSIKVLWRVAMMVVK